MTSCDWLRYDTYQGSLTPAAIIFSTCMPQYSVWAHEFSAGAQHWELCCVVIARKHLSSHFTVRKHLVSHTELLEQTC